MRYDVVEISSFRTLASFQTEIQAHDELARLGGYRFYTVIKRGE